jgi:hypothetical protein
MTEAEFQSVVIDLARLFKWRVAHFRPAKTSHGWRTPVQADGAGFPDLLLCRDRIIAIELKSDAGKLAPEQDEWLAAFKRAGIEAYCFKPSDLDEVAAVLRRRRVA